MLLHAKHVRRGHTTNQKLLERHMLISFQTSRTTNAMPFLSQTISVTHLIPSSLDPHFPQILLPSRNYYRAKRSLIQSQPTYLNPEQSRNQFGSVVRLPTGEILRRLRSQIFARGAVCSQTCLILSFLLIVTFINVVPLGIGITELCIGILYNHSECDQPLSDWLIAIGCVQSASWATSVHSSWHRRNLHDHQRTGAEKFLRTTNSILLFVGANWVYRSRSCDSRLLHFSWYLVTITVCFAFTVFFMYCCIFVSSRRIS
eukprot:c3900_g1_i2.p1 GENE.c3900_g1_i2~~c3900_g1_i2.p1  ORF type:complete len:259 (+),score=55.29 c3900_g1_i2:947-1723(+)